MCAVVFVVCCCVACRGDLDGCPDRELHRVGTVLHSQLPAKYTNPHAWHHIQHVTNHTSGSYLYLPSHSTPPPLKHHPIGWPSQNPHFTKTTQQPIRCPRPTSSVTRCSFDWSFELSTVKRMVADAQLWGRVVELSSPLHYFAGFWWQVRVEVLGKCTAISNLK